MKSSAFNVYDTYSSDLKLSRKFRVVTMNTTMNTDIRKDLKTEITVNLEYMRTELKVNKKRN